MGTDKRNSLRVYELKVKVEKINVYRVFAEDEADLNKKWESGEVTMNDNEDITKSCSSFVEPLHVENVTTSKSTFRNITNEHKKSRTSIK